MALAEQLEATITAHPDFEVVATRSLSLVVFRLHAPDLAPASLNTLNQSLFNRLMKRTDVLFTQTLLPGDLYVRSLSGTR